LIVRSARLEAVRVVALANKMPKRLEQKVNELLAAFERNSAALARNGDAMRLLVERRDRGELADEVVGAETRALVAASGRLQDERRALVSAHRDLKLRIAAPGKSMSRH
jgi:hypothetical protein